MLSCVILVIDFVIVIYLSDFLCLEDMENKKAARDNFEGAIRK